MYRSHQTSSKLVLCIDDDQQLLKLLQTYLETYGYSVLVEDDPHAGIRLAAVRAVDAAIIDCIMPGVDGAYCAAEIRRLRPAAAVIMFSAEAGPSERMLTLIDGFVHKSDGVLALLSLLRRLLDWKPSSSAPVRQFPRFPVHLPVTFTARRPGKTALLRGFVSSISEGGVGCKVEGDLKTGESVEIKFAERALQALRPRAEVRYQQSDYYGFQFLNLSALQEQGLRSFCQRLASA